MAEISIKINASSPVAVTAQKNKHQKLANLSEAQQAMIFELVDKPEAINKLIENKSFLMTFL